MKYSNKMVDMMLIDTPIIRLGDVVSSQIPILWRCGDCAHEWENFSY